MNKKVMTSFSELSQLKEKIVETGVVKFFKNGEGQGNGFGFITRDGGQGDIFAHISEFADRGMTLNEKDRVEFEVGEGRNGKPQAKNIRKI